jgi:eukaryotic-like serine/threonine-protein kinase
MILRTLRARVQTGPPLTIEQVSTIIDDLFTAVAKIHAQHQIDRALTPDRIVLDPMGRLSDLTEPPPPPARSEESDPDLAEFDTVVGSFSFMAPEQVRGLRDVDLRADIYAIGAIAFYALTRHLPFEGTSSLVLIAKKLERPPPTLESVTNKAFTPLLELFIATAMSPDRERRYPRIEVARMAWREATTTSS